LIAIFDFPESVPLPTNRRFLWARETLDRIIYGLIAERRRSDEDTGDLLSMFLAIRDETGRQLTNVQLRDEIMTLFVAGHETVSTALTWVWYLLSTHPDAAARLRAEVDGVLGGRTPTVPDLPRLEYLGRVIKEALRLYPPLWNIPRMPRVDDAIGGYRIPAGSFLLLSSYVTHHNPAFWENPEGFDPERFTKENSAGRPRYAYFPFSGGPRGCIGFPFANMEMQLVVAMVTQRYRLDLVPGHPVVLSPDISLRSKYGMLMTLHPVQAQHAEAAAREGAVPSKAGLS
jgi:cytochrome P450